MIPEITEEKKYQLMGSIFYGNPFHEAKEWSVENEIGKLWQRFGSLCQKYSFLIDKISKNKHTAYEIHLETSEYLKTNQYYVMTALEITSLEDLPLEMFVKILPLTKYAKFTTKINRHDYAEKIFSRWLPNSDYEQSYPYVMQLYDERFKGMEDDESELDWLIPIKEKTQEGGI